MPKSGKPKQSETAMDQHARLKAAHPDCVMLFRIGDFYETFHDDAKIVAEALGLTLTKRKDGVPLAGIPHHQLEPYLRRLSDRGFRVAVADQIEDAAQAKGVVQRAVTRVVTPGTLVDDALMAAEHRSVLAAVALDHTRPERVGSALIEPATGAFEVFEASRDDARDELARTRPSELLFATADLDQRPAPMIETLTMGLDAALTPRAVWTFRDAQAERALCETFGVASLDAYGLGEAGAARQAAGAAVLYLHETQPSLDEGGPTLAGRSSLQPPARIDATGVLDATSLRALEVERTMRSGALEGSLLGVFLRPGSAGGATGQPALCRTAMGKRRLRDWLRRPLTDAASVRARQARVATLVEDERLADELTASLDGVRDLSRIAGRLSANRATPRDLVALAESVSSSQQVAALICPVASLASIAAALGTAAEALKDLGDAIREAVEADPPGHLRQGGVFRDGIDAELDEARGLRRDAGDWLTKYQDQLSQTHQLPPLKVGYNKGFGYYLELTAVQAREHASGIDASGLQRQQTLKNAERYTTAELRDFDHKVSTAEARAIEREESLFSDLCASSSKFLQAMRSLSEAAAKLADTAALAGKARLAGWIRQDFDDVPVRDIEEVRHPVLDEALGHRFVPNSLVLAGPEVDEHAHVALITGPNMAGKSTFIRQTALLALLAQVGSYLPATRARIGVCDRSCTRVGADDALHQGRSTFMVEMTETASILHQSTERSLVVLDEIGRGTSTLDGLSLAWAIAEHLSRSGGPRTLFATHYHELTELADTHDGRLRNLHVAVREFTPEPTAEVPSPTTELVFVHRILPGRADQSYGVHVAELAGVPAAVTRRAREVLGSLAVEQRGQNASRVPAASPELRSVEAQLPLFREFVPHPVVDRLRDVKLDALSPLEAFDLLRALKGEVDSQPHAESS